MCYVQIDRCGIMHYVRIILSGENIACAAHICCQLINFIEWLVEHLPYHLLVGKIADHELVCRGCRKFIMLEIYRPYPISFRFQSFHQMPADKTAGTTN